MDGSLTHHSFPWKTWRDSRSPAGIPWRPVIHRPNSDVKPPDPVSVPRSVG